MKTEKLLKMIRKLSKKVENLICRFSLLGLRAIVTVHALRKQ